MAVTPIGLVLDPATVLEYERRYVLHSWTSQKRFNPIIIAGARGRYFWDESGKKYLDFASQLTNVNVGHQHPRILKAVKEQIDKLCYVVPSAANDQRALLAKRLADLTPGDLMRSFFTTGGGEANENALKIARTFTGRQKVIARYRSFHGGGYGPGSVMGDVRRIPNEPGVPGSVRVWDPYCYRCFFGMTYPQCNLRCAEAIREVIEVEGPESVAAIIVEPITGSTCRIVPPDGYMQCLRAICDDYGVLLVFDEVMTGFGRTGKWFASEHWQVVPDIMTLSKGINNGVLPMGAVVVRQHIADFFEDKILYAGLTQFGNPVLCASANATIEVMQEEGLVEASRTLGVHLMARLEAMKARHASIGEVRGKGLFAAIELVKDRESREPIVAWTVKNYENKDPVVSKIVARLKEEGVFTYSRWNVLFICPPLSISKDELDFGLEKIDGVLALADDYVARLGGTAP
jgi:taurine--2-oxoglutarate transaminase